MGNRFRDLLKEFKGNGINKTLTFQDENGNAVDITGWTVYFYVKNSPSDIDSNAEIQHDITNHTNPTQGETAIDVAGSKTSSLTGVYWYDISYDTGAGERVTVLFGNIKFEEGVKDP